MDKEALLEECKVGWLSVQSDFNGRLEKPELLKYALQLMGRNPSDKAIEHYWSQAGGSLSFEQFSLVMRRERKTSMSDLMRAFRKIDTNGDGFITSQELQRKLTKRGEKMSVDEVEAIIAEADLNGDGKLDYAEFCHMLLNTTEECIQANRQKTLHSQKLKKESRGEVKEKGRGAKRQSSEVQRKHSSERRQRRREEIRMHLYSPETKTPASFGLTNRGKVNSQRGLPNSSSVEELSVVKSDSSVGIHSPQDGSHTGPKLDTETRQDSGAQDSSSSEPNSCAGPDTTAHGHTNPTAPSIDDQNTNVLSVPAKLPPLKRTPLPPLQPPPQPQLNHAGGDTGNDHEEEGQSLEVKEPSKAMEEGLEDGEARQTDHLQGNEEGEREKSNSEMQGSVPSQSGEGPGSHEDKGVDTVVGSDENKTADKAGTEGETEAGTVDEETGAVDKEEVEEERTGESGSDRDKPQNGEISDPNKKSEEMKETVSISVVAPPPRKSKNFESWNSITGKGCFYLEAGEDSSEEHVIKCHHYHLKLPASTNVWVEVGVASPGVQDTDVLLFVFCMDSDEKITEVITYTQHKVDDHWVCRMDLEAGAYALIPFTSGCHLKPQEEEHLVDTPALPLVATGEGGVALTPKCRAALEEVFHRVDLDNNGYISRTEFDFFQEVTSGELCDDDAWNIILANFDVTSDEEITLNGFLQLHQMSAADEEGGEEEVWQVLRALGYNRQLELHQACPFQFEVLTEDCEGEIEIVDLLPFAPVTEPALTQLVMERGVEGSVKGEEEGELLTYTFTTPHLASVVVQNKSSLTTYVQLDCSLSVNCVSSRESTVHVMEIAAQSSSIGYHLQPANPQEPYAVHCTASKILT